MILKNEDGMKLCGVSREKCAPITLLPPSKFRAIFKRLSHSLGKNTIWGLTYDRQKAAPKVAMSGQGEVQTYTANISYRSCVGMVHKRWPRFRKKLTKISHNSEARSKNTKDRMMKHAPPPASLLASATVTATGTSESGWTVDRDMKVRIKSVLVLGKKI